MEDNVYGVVYKATNIVTGKVYVGQTIVGLRARKNKHINDALVDRDNNHFHNSIKKHGKNKFEWEIIDYAESKKELNDLEIHYIKQLKSFEAGYNLTEGGGGMTNYVITEEHRKNLSESHKGYKHTDEQRRKISKALTGRPVSEYTRKLISESNKGKIGLVGKKNPFYGIGPCKKARDRLVEVSSCLWEVIFPDGTEKVLKNLSAFCREHNLSKGTLCSVSNGYRPHHKGYKCKKITGLDKRNQGKKHSKETIKKMSLAKKGKNNHNVRAVIINDRHFDTLMEAAAFLKVAYQTVSYRIKTKRPGYSYA